MSAAEREIEIADAKAKEEQLNQAAAQAMQYANLVGTEEARRYASAVQKWTAEQKEHYLEYRARLQAAQDLQQARMAAWQARLAEHQRAFEMNLRAGMAEAEAQRAAWEAANREYYRTYQTKLQDAIRRQEYEEASYKQRYQEELDRWEREWREKTWKAEHPKSLWEKVEDAYKSGNIFKPLELWYTDIVIPFLEKIL